MNPIAYYALATAALAALTYYLHATSGPPMVYVAFAATVLAFWRTLDKAASTLLGR